jgi:signal transduction histidine kinase
VVINLLSNAVKFTDAGKITLKVRNHRRNGQAKICFSVIDTGIGVRAKDIDTVFEPFRQIDNSEARRAEGTGLGMPISYRLIKLHGGEMWIESRPSHGSTFSFTLPVNPPNSVPTGGIVHVDYRLD